MLRPQVYKLIITGGNKNSDSLRLNLVKFFLKIKRKGYNYESEVTWINDSNYKAEMSNGVHTISGNKKNNEAK